MIRILLVDDHPIVREGLKQALSEIDGFAVAGEAGNAAQVMEQLCRKEFDVVVLDISLPGKSGIDVLKEMQAAKAKTRVLILSTYSEDLYALRAIKAGASGYLTKNAALDILVDAIRKVAGGGKYISPSLAEELFLNAASDACDGLPHKTLSDREYEVLLRLAAGKTVSETGEELSLSVKTVSTYRARILDKMHMTKNSELTHYCLTRKLIE
jgi:DNA-binding NarL/FixJ family response regulator